MRDKDLLALLESVKTLIALEIPRAGKILRADDETNGRCVLAGAVLLAFDKARMGCPKVELEKVVTVFALASTVIDAEIRAGLRGKP